MSSQGRTPHTEITHKYILRPSMKTDENTRLTAEKGALPCTHDSLKTPTSNIQKSIEQPRTEDSLTLLAELFDFNYEAHPCGRHVIMWVQEILKKNKEQIRAAPIKQP